MTFNNSKHQGETITEFNSPCNLQALPHKYQILECYWYLMLLTLQLTLSHTGYFCLISRAYITKDTLHYKNGTNIVGYTVQHANSCTELQPHLDGVRTRRLPVHISRYHQTSLQLHSPSTRQEGGRGTSNTPLCNRRERESRRVGGALVTLPYVIGERERERAGGWEGH